MSMFPDPRRIVTGHNEKGEAVVLKDSRVSCLPTPYSASFAVLWETTEFPASNQGDYDPITVRTTDLSNKNGIILRVVDIPPHTAKDMLFHRTESLDFGLLFEGEVTCHLDNDVQIHMKPGDLCIQRGTIHGWTNSSDKPCRLYFVLIAADPVQMNGNVFKSTGYNKDKVASGGDN